MKCSNIFLVICVLMATAVFVLAGCSGGGGSSNVSDVPASNSTVSGVAASGIPLVGQVSLVDAKGTMAVGSPQNVNQEGAFSFDVTGLTPPFILKGDGTVGGKGVTMFSVALGSGTANVNPMSNIVVAAAAGVNDPALIFNDPGANAPKITTATLNKAVADMQTLMAPVLGTFNVTGANPVSGSFTANHTGLDAVFDVVQMPIDTTAGTMSVIDKTAGTSGATIGTAAITQMANPTQPITQVPSTAVPTDLQNISTMLSSMGSVLNKGASMTTADLAPFFVADPDFGINGGMTGTELMAQIQRNIPSVLGRGAITQMSNVTFDGNSPTGGYRISFAMRFADGSLTRSNQTFSDEMVVAKNAANGWQFKGNGHRSEMFNAMLTQQWQTAAGTQTEAGVVFAMLDAGNAFKSAVATGPGLPAPGGVTFAKEPDIPTMFRMTTANTLLPTMATTFFTMQDAAISQIPDNAPYVFAFYSSSPPRNNPVEQRTMTFPRRSFTRAEASGTNGLFPVVAPAGNLATHSFSTMMGSMMGSMMGMMRMGGSGMISMPFTYTTPTALPFVMMSANFTVSSSAFNNETNQTLPVNQNSMTMQMAGPATAPATGTGALAVTATDHFGRDVGNAWMFQ